MVTEVIRHVLCRDPSPGPLVRRTESVHWWESSAQGFGDGRTAMGAALAAVLRGPLGRRTDWSDWWESSAQAFGDGRTAMGAALAAVLRGPLVRRTDCSTRWES